MTNKAFNLQREVKLNAEDYQTYLKELYRWEDEIKVKDENLKKSTCKQLPNYPIRGKDINSQVVNNRDNPASPSSSLTKDKNLNETLSDNQKKQKAIIEKEKGNQFFKELQYEKAIACYSSAIELNSGDAILYANRAMAFLKLNKFKESEEDCNKSIKIDSSYVKAYHRRGVARLSLGLKDQAVKDFEEVLKKEPHNKAALQELERLKLPTTSTPSNKDSKEEKVKQETAIKPEASRKNKIVEIVEKVDKPSPKTTSEGLNLQHPSLVTVEKLSALPYSPQATEPKHTVKILKVHDTQHEKRIIDKVIKLVDGKERISEEPAQVSTAKRSASNALPPVPRNYAQFDQEWCKMRGDNELLFSYLKKITPFKLPEIFRESLEPDVLGDIIRLLKDQFAARKEPIFPWLHGLSSVKRIRAVVLFLPSDLKLGLADLAKSLTSDEVSEADRENVLKSLGV